MSNLALAQKYRPAKNAKRKTYDFKSKPCLSPFKPVLCAVKE